MLLLFNAGGYPSGKSIDPIMRVTAKDSFLPCFQLESQTILFNLPNFQLSDASTAGGGKFHATRNKFLYLQKCIDIEKILLCI
jgi:hypothetical protein